MKTPLSPEQLEQLIHRELRQLPPRRAPRSLESRVLAAIEHRAAVAWYHKSWSYWPAAVRAAFLGIATALVGLGVTACFLLWQGIDTAAVAHEVSQRFGWATRLVGAGEWVVNLCSHLVAGIPSFWLYGILALVAGLYATFFGLGAAAYRVLYRNN